jgi:DNA-binding CsgD family transcriptional regulator
MSPHKFVVPALDAGGRSLADEHAETDATAAANGSGDLEALLAHASVLAQMGSWELDLRTGTSRWSAGMYRILGLEPDAAGRSAEVVLESVHPDDRQRVAALIAAVAEDPAALPQEREPVEFRVVRGDGGVRDVRAYGRIECGSDGRPQRWLGAVQDVTDVRVGDRELRARHGVSEALGEWENYEEGAVCLLDRVGTALGYAMGAVWHWDDEREAAVAGAFWSRPGIEPEPFATTLRAQTFRLGEGGLGRVWDGQEQPVITDIAIDPVFRPRSAALQQGLRTALAFPALDERGVPVAVLSFYCFERREPGASLLRTVSGIGREVGAFLARHRAHLGPRALSKRELEVLRLAADGHTGPVIARLLVVAPSTIKTHFNNIYAKLGVSDRAAAVAVALRSGLIQ